MKTLTVEPWMNCLLYNNLLNYKRKNLLLRHFLPTNTIPELNLGTTKSKSQSKVRSFPLL